MSKRLVIADMYSRFKYKKQNDLVEILKSTKDLVVNSRKYRSYSRDYNMTTHINSFKRPEIETYPIIRNTELIPLNKTLFDYSPEKAKNNLRDSGFKILNRTPLTACAVSSASEPNA